LIGASTTPGLYVMSGIVGAFRAKYPGVDSSWNSSSATSRGSDHCPRVPRRTRPSPNATKPESPRC